MSTETTDEHKRPHREWHRWADDFLYDEKEFARITSKRAAKEAGIFGLLRLNSFLFFKFQFFFELVKVLCVFLPSRRIFHRK